MTIRCNDVINVLVTRGYTALDPYLFTAVKLIFALFELLSQKFVCVNWLCVPGLLHVSEAAGT